MENIKDLSRQALNSLEEIVGKTTWTDEEIDSFMKESLDSFIKKMEDKHGKEFTIFNEEDKIPFSMEAYTLAECIDMVQKFPQRYIKQNGMYKNNRWEYIPANEVVLIIKPV